MTELVDHIAANPLGRIFYLLARPVVNLFRRTKHPDIPTTQVITKVQFGDRTIAIRHRRWSADDALAIKQCFEQKQYDMPTGPQGVTIQRVYDEILASGRKPLIIDCGANIGASVNWFAARYPQARIVAVEPSPENFTLLRLNTAYLDVELHEAGIAATDGQAYLKAASDMGNRTTTEAVGIPVKMISIPTLLAANSASEYTPFLLNRDIEGAEQPLFSGDTACFDLFPLIVIEPHDWMIPGQLTSQPFFRFHAAAGREFCMNNENIASIALYQQPAQPSISAAYR